MDDIIFYYLEAQNPGEARAPLAALSLDSGTSIIVISRTTCPLSSVEEL